MNGGYRGCSGNGTVLFMMVILLKRFRSLTFPVMLSVLVWAVSCRNNDAGEGGADLDVSACMAATDSATVDVLTWNIREFPLSDSRTIEQVAKIIRKQDPDVIAFQEITSRIDFDKLLDQLPAWDGKVVVNGDLNLAYLFKISEVSLVRGPEILFEGDYGAFPRLPLLVVLRHRTGLEWTLIDIHLKCCSGEENEIRRRAAAEKLKRYLDDQHPDDAVMVLGDYNDVIAGVPDGDNVFIDFINDTLHYRFADMDIARGSKSRWSYPAWPGHIDHFLVTDELFGNILEAVTLPYDMCDYRYYNDISDHRPVMVRMKEH